ncbi:oxidoreductase activity, acting on NAD(P)H, oxygen as acceptor [Batrachochytrium dendrobatidis]|nr:oxidoreductase activity, acting on NAD(P)H, oxygen as acceptor [Batrachochytrium dendrobatidis]
MILNLASSKNIVLKRPSSSVIAPLPIKKTKMGVIAASPRKPILSPTVVRLAARILATLAMLVALVASYALASMVEGGKLRWSSSIMVVDRFDQWILGFALLPMFIATLSTFFSDPNTPDSIVTGRNDEYTISADGRSSTAHSTPLHCSGFWNPRFKFLGKYSTLFKPWSRGDIMITCLLVISNILWWIAPVITRLYLKPSKTLSTPRGMLARFAIWAAMAGLWNAAMAIVFVVRENHITKNIVGKDAGQFHRGLRYHIALGYTSFVQITFHGTYYLTIMVIDGAFPNEILPTLSDTGYSNFFGFLAWLSLMLMALTSIFKVRRANYRIFYWTHQLYTCFLLFAFMHQTRTWYPVMASLVYFIFDRLLPRLKTQRTTSALLTRVSPSVVRLDIAILQTYADSCTYSPGSWVNILVPSISHFNWHPFSISSSHHLTPRTVTLYIKARGAWTTQLHASSTGLGVMVPIKMDGFFGSRNNSYLSYQHLVVVGAGTGIATIIPYIYSYAQHTLGKITVFWLARTAVEACAYRSLLEALSDPNSPLAGRVDLHLHLTREQDSRVSTKHDHRIGSGFNGNPNFASTLSKSVGYEQSSTTTKPSYRLSAIFLSIIVFSAAAVGYVIGRTYVPAYNADECNADEAYTLVGLSHFMCWYYPQWAPTGFACLFAAISGLAFVWMVSLMKQTDAAVSNAEPIDVTPASFEWFKERFTWVAHRPNFAYELESVFNFYNSIENQSNIKIAVIAGGPERMVRDIENVVIDHGQAFFRESWKM